MTIADKIKKEMMDSGGDYCLLSSAEYTRIGIARDPNTPLKMLIKLLKDENQDVRKAALQNPSLPKEIKTLSELFQTK